jgi:hypothetical protein
MDAVNPQCLAAVQALKGGLAAEAAERKYCLFGKRSKKWVPPSGEMAEWLKAAVC